MVYFLHPCYLVILGFLNEKNNNFDGIRKACRTLQIASVQATIDTERVMQNLEGGKAELNLTPRVEAAFKLLSYKQSEDEHLDDDEFGCHLSAVQHLFAEMDSLLDMIVPPPAQDDGNKEAVNWRIRYSMQIETVRSVLGLPLSLILHVPAGPLTGVCLRNLIWHGHVGPIGCRCWSYLLWMVVALEILPRCRRLTDVDTQQPVPTHQTTNVFYIKDYVPSEEVV